MVQLFREFKLAHRLFIGVIYKNYRNRTIDWKLLESLGFSREAYLKQNVYFWKDEKGTPIWKDTYIHSLLNKSSAGENKKWSNYGIF